MAGREAARKILQLRQDSLSVADYAVDFRHASSGGCLELDTFLHGLTEELKDELVARELPTDLDSLIALTIRIDGRLRAPQQDGMERGASKGRRKIIFKTHQSTPSNE